MEFPEGYYSIKDSMEDLSKNEEALALATRLSSWPPTLTSSPALACGI